ncbi:MAG: hypothetical protein ABI783_09420, partial [Actinomycetota bacterium]
RALARGRVVAGVVGDPRERFLVRYAGGFAPFTVARRAEGAWVETTERGHEATCLSPFGSSATTRAAPTGCRPTRRGRANAFHTEDFLNDHLRSTDAVAHGEESVRETGTTR